MYMTAVFKSVISSSLATTTNIVCRALREKPRRFAYSPANVPQST